MSSILAAWVAPSDLDSFFFAKARRSCLANTVRCPPGKKVLSFHRTERVVVRAAAIGNHQHIVITSLFHFAASDCFWPPRLNSVRLLDLHVQLDPF